MKKKNRFNRPTELLSKSIPDLRKELYPKYTMVVPDSQAWTIEAAHVLKDSGILDGERELSIVECGVWRGGMSVLLARLFPENKIFMCDSYKGFEPIGYSPRSLPLADDPDGPAYGKERHFPEKIWVWQEETVSPAVSVEEVRKNLAHFGLIPEKHGIEMIEGYIRDTLPKHKEAMGDIAMLRVDVDAYAATYEVLELLYDQVVPGGVIIFDDFSGVEEATVAINAFQKDRNLTFNYIPDGRLGCYIQKG